MAEGHTPRFFGKSVQRDYEADIVTESGNMRSVFQCKNTKKEPSLSAIQKTIDKFEKEWIGDAGLPRPEEYIYCCPHQFADLKFNEVWEEYRDSFHGRTTKSVFRLEDEIILTRA